MIKIGLRYIGVLHHAKGYKWKYSGEQHNKNVCNRFRKLPNHTFSCLLLTHKI